MLVVTKINDLLFIIYYYTPDSILLYQKFAKNKFDIFYDIQDNKFCKNVATFCTVKVLLVVLVTKAKLV